MFSCTWESSQAAQVFPASDQPVSNTKVKGQGVKLTAAAFSSGSDCILKR